MTAQEARNQAIAAVRAQQGLTGIPPSEWSYAQRTAYNQALSAYILERPGQFTSQDLSTATNVFGKAYSPLQDTAFDWSQFGDEFGKNSGAFWSGFQLTLNKVLAILGIVLFFILFEKSKPART